MPYAFGNSRIIRKSRSKGDEKNTPADSRNVIQPGPCSEVRNLSASFHLGRPFRCSVPRSLSMVGNLSSCSRA